MMATTIIVNFNIIFFLLLLRDGNRVSRDLLKGHFELQVCGTTNSAGY